MAEPIDAYREPAPVRDPRLLDAAETVLAEAGWDGLTMERVAVIAGVSRATVWRQNASREALLAGLLARLAEDYQRAMWPVLTSDMTGLERLTAAANALCDTADRHLPALMASDNVFHGDFPGPASDLLGPFARALRDGIADGTLRALDDPDETAEVLFNAVCWPYVHLRARHEWPVERARAGLWDLLSLGLAVPTTHAAAVDEGSEAAP